MDYSGLICVFTSWRLLGVGHHGKNIPFNQANTNSGKPPRFGKCRATHLNRQRSAMKPKRHVYFVNEPNWLVQCVLGKWEMNKLEIKVNFFLHIPFTVKIEKFCACDFQHSG